MTSRELLFDGVRNGFACPSDDLDPVRLALDDARRTIEFQRTELMRLTGEYEAAKARVDQLIHRLQTLQFSNVELRAQLSESQAARARAEERVVGLTLEVQAFGRAPYPCRTSAPSVAYGPVTTPNGPVVAPSGPVTTTTTTPIWVAPVSPTQNVFVSTESGKNEVRNGNDRDGNGHENGNGDEHENGSDSDSPTFQRRGLAWKISLTHEQVVTVAQGASTLSEFIPDPEIQAAVVAAIAYIQLVDRLGGNRGVDISGVIGTSYILVTPRGTLDIFRVIAIISGIAADISQTVQREVGERLKDVNRAFSRLNNALKSGSDDAVKAAEDAIRGVADTATQAAGDAVQAGKDIITGAVDAAGDVAHQAEEIARDIFHW